METEKTKEIRKEFCSIKGWNYLEFDCLEDAEEYIIFLESKVNDVVLDAVIKCFECEKKLNTDNCGSLNQICCNECNQFFITLGIKIVSIGFITCY